MGEFSFPASCRLTRSYDYKRVYRNGRKIPSKHFHLFCLPASGLSRIGLACGRNVGSAVIRNRVKRRLREICRRLRPGFAFTADVVLVAHPQAADLTTREMEAEIVRLLKTARLIA